MKFLKINKVLSFKTDNNMKHYIFTLAVFCFLIFLSGKLTFSQSDTNMVDLNFYDTFEKVNYQDLPLEIKKIMLESKCGEIGADPSQYNDYKTNYDLGFMIDLNDDKVLEYVFCCEAPSHGPCDSKIYSLVKGNWSIILDKFPLYVVKPQDAIKILTSTSESFHDLLRSDILSTRSVILKFVNGKYYPIYYPKEALSNIMSHMDYYSKSINSCYVGLTNNAYEVINKYYPNIKEESIVFFALESELVANELKENLISKGMHFIEDHPQGQIIFCITKDPK